MRRSPATQPLHGLCACMPACMRAPLAGAALACVLGTAVLCVAAAGCEAPLSGSARPWAYGPTLMRIHPISRVSPATASAPARIDVRIEFTDADGQVTRAMGRLSVSADLAGCAPMSASVDLDDRAANRAAWDAATRTYLVTLKPEPPPPASERPTVRVRAQWESPEGLRRSDSATIAPSGRAPSP